MFPRRAIIDNSSVIGVHMMTRLQEKLLLKCSKTAEQINNQNHFNESSQTALLLLERVYTNFADEVRGKLVCDFGCGVGQQCIALAHSGARRVLGVDNNPRRISEAKKIVMTQAGPYAPQIEFSEGIESSHQGQFDVVISQNSMEHFSDPAATLDQMKLLLNPAGRLLVTFGPPWYAPYGAHMQFFTQVPWVHLLFSEKSIMNVRKRYRQDGAEKFEEVESGLNKMSVAKFERLIKESGLKIVFKNYQGVRGLGFLKNIPVIRELCINHVSVALALVDGLASPAAGAFSSRVPEVGFGSIIPGFSARGRSSLRPVKVRGVVSRFKKVRSVVKVVRDQESSQN